MIIRISILLSFRLYKSIIVHGKLILNEGCVNLLFVFQPYEPRLHQIKIFSLVCSSARSLSEKASDESYDVFIQIFDPTGKMDDANNYTTSGTRSGFGGGNGDTSVTDYGVKWLTNFAETDKTVDVVQAVTTDSGNIVVLYELYTKITRSYDSTWYMILDTSGNVVCESRNLGDVRLNIDEDPVYINKTVQWVSNIEGSDELRLNVLTVDDMYN